MGEVVSRRPAHLAGEFPVSGKFPRGIHEGGWWIVRGPAALRAFAPQGRVERSGASGCLCPRWGDRERDDM